MPGYEVGIPLLFHHVLVMLSLDDLSPLLSNSMHLGSLFKLWPQDKVTTTHLVNPEL